MTTLTFKDVTSLFLEKYPHGTITKQSTCKYEVCFDARDSRSEAQKELAMWGASADTRKFYTYRVNNLTGLATKLKLIEEPEFKLSKANQEWEEWLKQPEEEIDLFA